MYFQLGFVMVQCCCFFGKQAAGKHETRPASINQEDQKRSFDRFSSRSFDHGESVDSIVARKRELVSVEAIEGQVWGIHTSFDETFLNGLDENEPVPRLHTNWGTSGSSHTTLIFRQNSWQIRLRCGVVSREELERIYAKVWRNNGDVDMKEFLGEDTAVGLKRRNSNQILPRTTDRLSHP